MKPNTKAQVYGLRLANPKMPPIRIAEQVGKSKARISQILIELKLPTRILLPPKLCRVCGEVIPRKYQSNLCRKCFHEAHYVQLVCDNEECGRQYEIRRSDFNHRQKDGQTHHFCSQQCAGKRIGKIYGFGSPNETEKQLACQSSGGAASRRLAQGKYNRKEKDGKFN